MNSSTTKKELQNCKLNESMLESKLNIQIEKHKPEEKKKGIYKNLISGVN